MSPDRSHAMDHVVLVLFENRSADNLLGRLYGPEDGKAFEGVLGKELSNPIPEWAQHGAERKTVPYTGEAVSAPWNAPEPGAAPTMDGFVTDYISTFTAEIGRQPTYDEYAQIMTGYTPDQVPVLSTIAKGFGVFDHWFCEVPSQTFMNRSFWTAATSSSLTVNHPVGNWIQSNTAETLFDRLEAHGRTWKVYIQEPMVLSFTGIIHMPRLKDRLATHFVPYAEFEQDAANGTLPDFSLIEPNMAGGHSDYHPAYGRSFIPDDVNIPLDPPSAIGGGEAFLARIYNAVRSAASTEGSNVYNTLFFIGWDEPGGTYDHVPPGPVPPPDPAAPAGQLGFTFDRSGYRVPAIIVSPWVDEGIVINEEHRHTSMIATLRKVWGIGDAFTDRDAAAAPLDHLLSRDSPRDPATWPDVEPLPVSEYHMDMAQMGKALSTLGKTAGGGMLEHAKQMGIAIPPELTDPNPTPQQVVAGVRKIAGEFFPRLATKAT